MRGRPSSYATADAVGLIVLSTPHDREGELIRLRRHFGPGRFNAVPRVPGGVVRVFDRNSLAVWDGSRWWEKPYATTYAKAVLRSIPQASDSALEAILEFCVHGLSPSPAGATLVWTLDDSLLTELATSEVRMPSLALQDRTTHAPARHLLSQVDGAALLTSAAELVDIRVYLRASA